MKIQLRDGSYYELPDVGVDTSGILPKKRKDYTKFLERLSAPTTTEPVAAPKKQKGFGTSFAEGFTTLGDLPEALKYGISNDDSTRDALIKEAQGAGDTTGFFDIRGPKDFFNWAKQLAGQSLGFIAPAAGAAVAATKFINPLAGTVAGGITLLGQYLTTNLGRQAQENKARVDAGELQKDASIEAALGSAAGQTALDLFGLRFFPGIAKMLGFEGLAAQKTATEAVSKEFARETAKKEGAKKILAITNESLKKGAGKGIAFEVPQELGQTVLERAQAGLSLTDEGAVREYIETAAGAALLGAPIGAINQYPNIKKAIAEEEAKIKAETKPEPTAPETEEQLALPAPALPAPALPAPETGEPLALPAPMIPTPQGFTMPSGKEIETASEQDFLKTIIKTGKKAAPEPKTPEQIDMFENAPVDTSFVRARDFLVNDIYKGDLKREPINRGKSRVITALNSLGITPPKKAGYLDLVNLLKGRVVDLDNKIEENNLTQEDIDAFLPSKIQSVRNTIDKANTWKSAEGVGKPPSMSSANKAASVLGMSKASLKGLESIERIEQVEQRLRLMEDSIKRFMSPPEEVSRKQMALDFGLEPTKEELTKEQQRIKEESALEMAAQAEKNKINKFFDDVNNRTKSIEESFADNLKGRKYVYRYGNPKEIAKAIANKKPLIVSFTETGALPKGRTTDAKLVRIPIQGDMIGDAISKQDGLIRLNTNNVNVLETKKEKGGYGKNIIKEKEKKADDIKAKQDTTRKGVETPPPRREPTRRAKTVDPRDVDRDRRPTTEPDRGVQEGEGVESNPLDELNEIYREGAATTPEDVTPEQRGFFSSLGGAARKAYLFFAPIKQLGQIWGEKYNSIKNAADLVDERSKTFNRYLNEVQVLTDRIQSYLQANPAKSDKFMDLVLESSYYDIDASNPDPGYTDAEQQKQYTKKRAEYNRLDEEAKTIYKDIKNHFDNNYTLLKQALIKKVQDSELTEAAKEEATEKLETLFSEHKKLNFYFPFQRSGDYWLKWDIGERQEPVKMAFRTERERDEAYAEVQAIRKRRPDLKATEPIKYEVTNSEKAESAINKISGGINSQSTLFKLLDIVRKGSKDNPQAKERMVNDITQMYLNSLPEQSMLRSMMRGRQNILGFKKYGFQDVDFVDMFNTKALSMARQQANAEYDSLIQRELVNVDKETQGTKDRDLYKNIAEQYALIKNPDVGKTYEPDIPIWGRQRLNPSTMAGKLGYFWYLATPAAAIVNVLHTPIHASAHMVGKFSQSKTFSEIAKALSDISKQSFERGLTKKRPKRVYTHAELFGKTTDQKLNNRKYTVGVPNLGNREEEKAMARAILDRTISELGQVGSTIGTAPEGDVPFAKSKTELAIGQSTSGKVMDFLFGAFPKAEQLNREVTFLAAYRLAKKDPSALQKGKKYKDAFEYATHITDQAHGDYSYNNAGLAFKSPNIMMKSALMFKKFPLFMYYNYYSAYKDWNKKNPNLPEEAKQEAKRQLFSMLGYAFVAAGLKGIPAYFALEFMLEALLGLGEDEPVDGGELIRRNTGELFYGGALQYLTNIALSDRIGYGQAPVRVPYGQNEDFVYNMFTMFGGPLVGIGTNLSRGANMMLEGDFARGLEAATPLFLKNTMKAVRYIEEGTATTKGGLPIVDEVSKFQAFMQFIGFTPEEVARQYELNNARKVLSDAVNSKRMRLIAAANASAIVRDNEQLSEAYKEIAKFNSTYPLAEIKFSSLKKSVKMTQRLEFLNAQLGLGGMRMTPKMFAYTEQKLGAFGSSKEED